MNANYVKAFYIALVSSALLTHSMSAFAINTAETSKQAITISADSVTKEMAESIMVDQDDPYTMVEQVASKTFARIKAEQDIIRQNPETFRTIMEDELMPYIDYRFSAFKVLGKYARSVEIKELQEFVTVFREYLITSYAVAMGYYDNQTVSFDPEREFSNRTDVTVRAVIKDDVRPEIKVAFKVRKDPKSGKWQAYDMIAEGISMLSSKQSEFESVLRREGIASVIEQMRESIRQPIVLQNDKKAS